MHYSPQCSPIFILCAAIILLAPLQGNAQSKFSIDLKDRDRVVFVGDGLLEYAQQYGYIELALTTRWPDRSISFRNLGWSGDTVHGEARDHYTNPPTPYEHLIEQITTTQPTVLVFGYGGTLAFQDPSAMAPFIVQFNTLLDDLASLNARCVLLAPIPHETQTSPNPDVTQLNINLANTRYALASIAKERDCDFIDLFAGMAEAYEQSPTLLTSNGIHLNTDGYRHLATLIEGTPSASSIMVDISSREIQGGQLIGTIQEETDDFRFSIIPASLDWKEDQGRLFSIKGLRRGTFTLYSKGNAIATASASEWERGVRLVIPSEQQQAEALRTAIIEKNALYFRQYRPQNETYLVGFRRYEQGQNAPELDQLAPLIDEKENEIGRLRTPIPLTFTLARK